MRLVGLSAALVFAFPAASQLVGFDAEFSGSVNGGEIRASGSGDLDIDQGGRSQARVVFDAIPGSFDPLAASLISNLCANAFRADGGSRNLWDLSNGDYSVDRTFQWIGLPGSVLSVNSVVTNDDERVSSLSSIEGVYNGPTDIIGISSYSVTWLPSSTPGEFFEAGTAVLERATGDTLIMQFASIFSGLDAGLTEPQTGIGLLNTSFDGTTLSLDWDGEFRVVPSPAGATLFAVAAGFTLRRRR